MVVPPGDTPGGFCHAGGLHELRGSEPFHPESWLSVLVSVGIFI